MQELTLWNMICFRRALVPAKCVFGCVFCTVVGCFSGVLVIGLLRRGL